MLKSSSSNLMSQSRITFAPKGFVIGLCYLKPVRLGAICTYFTKTIIKNLPYIQSWT